MGDYKATDPILRAWADARGLHVYTGHKQNDVRSMTVYIWIGARHESTGHARSAQRARLIGVHAAAGSYRFDESVSPDRLAAALDAVSDRLADYKQRVDAQISISPRM